MYIYIYIYTYIYTSVRAPWPRTEKCPGPTVNQSKVLGLKVLCTPK